MLFHSLVNNISFLVSKEVSGEERKWSDSGLMKILCCWFWWVDKARCQAPIYWLLRDGHFPQATSSCCEIMWIMGTGERLSWWRGLLSTSCGWLSDSVSGSACSAISKHSSKSEQTNKCFVFSSSFHFLLIEPAVQDNRKQLGWDDAIALVAPTC